MLRVVRCCSAFETIIVIREKYLIATSSLLMKPVSKVEMHTSKHQVENDQALSDGSFQEHGFASETRAVAPSQPLVPSETQPQFQPEPYMTSDHMTGEPCRGQAEVEVCSVPSTEGPWAHKGNELLPAEDRTSVPPTTVRGASPTSAQLLSAWLDMNYLKTVLFLFAQPRINHFSAAQ